MLLLLKLQSLAAENGDDRSYKSKLRKESKKKTVPSGTRNVLYAAISIKHQVVSPCMGIGKIKSRITL
jgi:hypothetical protein